MGGGGGMRDMRPGDWSCPKCQFHNFSSRGMCYKCNSPRGGCRGVGGGGGGGRVVGIGCSVGVVVVVAVGGVASIGVARVTQPLCVCVSV